MKYLKLLLLNCILLSQGNAFGIDCSFAWLNSANGQKVLNNKVIIGNDTGKIPKNFDTGLYECNIHLNKLSLNHFLFIGEVGDASYLEVVVDGHKRTFYHGLDPISKDKKYLRFLPFIVPVDSFAQKEGVYNLKIYFQEIYPGQTGLRSGRMTVLPLKDSILKYVINSKYLSFFLIQVFLLFLFSFFIMIYPGLDFTHKVLISLTSLSSSLTMLSLTSIPRLFLPVQAGLIFNDFIHVNTWLLIFTTFLSFNLTNMNFNFIQYILTSSLSLVILVSLFSTKFYDTIYFSLLFYVVPVRFSYFLFNKRNNNYFISDNISNKYLKLLFVYLVFVFTFDCTNYFIFSMSLPFISQYLSYSLVTIGLFYYLVRYKFLVNNMLRNIDHLVYDISLDLNAFSDSKYFCSILLKYTKKVLNTEHLLVEISNKNTACNNSIFTQDINDNYKMNVSLTKSDLQLSPVVSNNIRPWAQSLENLTNRYSLYHSVLEKDKLLTMMRKYIHKIQLDSENFFLKNFEMNKDAKEHALILGDLVKSTTLNEIYGAQKIRVALEIIISKLWESTKEYGVIYELTKGDRLSITIPTLNSDDSINDLTERAVKVISIINNSRDLFEKTSKENGIYHELAFRYASTVSCSIVHDIEGSKSFIAIDNVADESVDSLARIIDNISLPNEVLLTDSFIKSSKDHSIFFKLQDIRLKGKINSISIYKLKNQRKLLAS